MVRLLLSHGVSVTARDSDGRTSLLFASRFASRAAIRADSVSLLLSHGADIEAQDNNGDTAMMWGSQCIIGVATAQCLRQHAANTEPRNNKGESALNVAEHWDTLNTEMVALLKQHRQYRANWTVITPLLTCMQIYHSSSTSSSSSLSFSPATQSLTSPSLASSPAVFVQSIDALLPTIRRYAGCGESLVMMMLLMMLMMMMTVMVTMFLRVRMKRAVLCVCRFHRLHMRDL